jgi:hypothetical protein
MKWSLHYCCNIGFHGNLDMLDSISKALINRMVEKKLAFVFEILTCSKCHLVPLHDLINSR